MMQTTIACTPHRASTCWVGRHLHGVDDGGVHVPGWATVRSADVALVGLGGSLTAFPVPFVLDGAPTQFCFVLFDNVRGTNDVECWSFEDADSDTQYRFEVHLHAASAGGGGESVVGGGRNVAAR